MFRPNSRCECDYYYFFYIKQFLRNLLFEQNVVSYSTTALSACALLKKIAPNEATAKVNEPVLLNKSGVSGLFNDSFTYS